MSSGRSRSTRRRSSKIEVAAIGDVSRAKLYYLRGRVGKKARVREVQRRGPLSSADAVAEGVGDGARARTGRPPTPSNQSSSPKSLKSPPSPKQKLQPSPQSQSQNQKSPKPKPKRPGRKLLAFDRRLGARFVAGTDEAGRGSLAGPLVVAGVLFDYECLRDHRVRPLALPERLEATDSPASASSSSAPSSACAAKGSRCGRSPPAEIDATGLHRSNLAAMRAILWELSPPAEICLVDGFRLGPTAPEHRAVVDGDEKSAAIAAASIVAKVVA